MGNQQLFIPSRGFSTELYMDHNGFEAKEVNGVKGKVLLKKNDPKGGAL